MRRPSLGQLASRARRGRLGFTRFILPAFFVFSFTVWVLAPEPVLRKLTPVVGTLAVLSAGLSLARVLWHIRGFSRRHQHRLDRVAPGQLKQLRRSMVAMALVLVATAAMAAGFYLMSTTILNETTLAAQSRLLWLLTAGGLALAVVFGELVSHLVVLVDETLLALDRQIQSD